MCGIVGMVSRTGLPPLDSQRRRSILASIRHRGPDADGQYCDEQLWFGHVRLSILDLSSAGNQPMMTSDGDFIIVYNGEVYNFREIAGELSLSDLRSRSDTEVILRAFEAGGVQSLRNLNGMFAFALYHKSARKLWLVRDRLGIKPLYYSMTPDGLVFGSEIKSILQLLEDAPSCNVSALHEWLYYGNALGGKTLYADIHQLQPGCYLELDMSSFQSAVKPYWSVRELVERNDARAGADDIVSDTRRLLEQAVRRQLVSDVPVAVFLSGGVDSSAITAIASRFYEGRLTTYSAGFDDVHGVDERPKARRVAQYYGTDHHELHVGRASLPDLVEKMVHHHDMPFSDSANIPLFLMAQEISATTKVVLQGDGGDEVFGGYRRYVSLRHRRLLAALARAGGRFAEALPNSFFSRRVRRYAGAFGADDVAGTMARLLTPIDPRSSPESIFTPVVREMLGRFDPFERYRQCRQLVIGSGSTADEMLLVDLMIELPDIFLEKVDRSTMAASLEVRVPFLDHDLVDYVVRLPASLKMRRGVKKWLLKRALAGVVPHDVLHAPKTGFSVPFGYWLRTALKPLFFDHLARFERSQPGVLDRMEIERRYAAMQNGQHDRAYTLWNLLNLMIWCNQKNVSLTRANEETFPVRNSTLAAAAH
jgi:asparagine synthase (glutamine-hydrolysing)